MLEAVHAVLRSSSKMGVERALKSDVFDHVSLFSLANLPARAQTVRFQRTFHPHL
jgi:hypothetical protein